MLQRNDRLVIAIAQTIDSFAVSEHGELTLVEILCALERIRFAITEAHIHTGLRMP